jgi:hypothetical protein
VAPGITQARVRAAAGIVNTRFSSITVITRLRRTPTVLCKNRRSRPHRGLGHRSRGSAAGRMRDVVSVGHRPETRGHIIQVEGDEGSTVEGSLPLVGTGSATTSTGGTGRLRPTGATSETAPRSPVSPARMCPSGLNGDSEVPNVSPILVESMSAGRRPSRTTPSPPPATNVPSGVKAIKTDTSCCGRVAICPEQPHLF